MVRTTSRRWSIAAALMIAVSSIAGAATPGTNGDVAHMTAVELHAAVAQTKNGLATSPLKTGAGLGGLMVRRETSGVVEIHYTLNDMLVIEEGSASIVVGGTSEGGEETAPHEWRGGKIIGGRTTMLAAGDILWIPAGVPHMMIVPPGKSIDYLAFKADAVPVVRSR